MATFSVADTAKPAAAGALWGLRLLLGAILVVSAWGKMHQPFDFLAAVYGYQILGPTGGLLVASLLPAAELVVGVALVVGVMRSSAALAAVGLGTIFLGAQISAVGHGLAIDCGCFGGSSPASHQVGWATLIRAVIWLAAAGVIYAYSLRRWIAPSA